MREESIDTTTETREPAGMAPASVSIDELDLESHLPFPSSARHGKWQKMLKQSGGP